MQFKETCYISHHLWNCGESCKKWYFNLLKSSVDSSVESSKRLFASRRFAFFKTAMIFAYTYLHQKSYNSTKDATPTHIHFRKRHLKKIQKTVSKCQPSSYKELFKLFDIWNESTAMTGIRYTVRIFPPILTHPTSFVTFLPTNKIKLFLLTISQWRKRRCENCMLYIYIYIYRLIKKLQREIDRIWMEQNISQIGQKTKTLLFSAKIMFFSCLNNCNWNNSVSSCSTMVGRWNFIQILSLLQLGITTCLCYFCPTSPYLQAKQ